MGRELGKGMTTIESLNKLLSRLPQVNRGIDTNQLNTETMKAVLEARRAKDEGSPDAEKLMAEAHRVLEIAWGKRWGDSL
jgi:hypothetical protein